MAMSNYLMSLYLSKYAYVSSQRVHIVHSNNKLSIAFRGTTNKQEVLRFFKMKQKPLYVEERGLIVGHVHSGFLGSFQTIKPIISEAITRYNPQKITFSGHSKGGALAKIASVYYNSVFDKQVSCHCFGSPRVGDELFLQEYNMVVDQFNMAHFNDFVVTLPTHYPLENVSYFNTTAVNPHSINAYIRTLVNSINAIEGTGNINFKNDEEESCLFEDYCEGDSKIV